MATFTHDFPELLETRAKTIFFKNVDPLGQLFRQLFAVVSTTRPHEDRLRIAGVGRFAAKPEGTPFAFDDPIQGIRRRVTVQSYGLGYRNTHEAISDDQWGVLNQMPADLGDSARDYMERLAWDVINDGWTGATHTGLENQALFVTNHATLRPEVAAQSNTLNPPVALSVTGIEDIMTMARTTLTEEGRFSTLRQQYLVIHPALEHQAYVLLNTEKRPGSADNDVSTVRSTRSGLMPIIVPYKTSQTNWSVHAGPGTNTLQVNEREGLSFSQAIDADTKDIKHYAMFRWSVMFSEWRNNFGSNFS